jgi:adenylate cyclase
MDPSAGSIGWLDRLASAGVLATDSEDERLRKATLTLAPLVIIPLAGIWVVTYWTQGLELAASIPFTYQIFSAASLVIFFRTKRYRFFRFTQLLLTLLLPFVLQLSLGGFVASSGVILWSLTSPLGALMFSGRRQATRWLMAFLGLIAIAAVLEPALPDARLPRPFVITFFVLNVGAVSGVSYFLLQYFVRERDRLRQRSEQLLRNVLPEPIAERLKAAPGVIADGFDESTVLFADIVNFTPLSEGMPPVEVVALLDEVFTAFDQLATRYGLEKIKTIGDAYMVAGGIPVPRPDHAEAVAGMALDMRAVCVRLGRARGTTLAVRIGMDTGPVVAGVIGRSKFIYDLWGDTVNTASRMESHGVPGQIQVTERVERRLRGRYSFEPRGSIEVKGKGRMPTYLLLGPR